MQAKQSSTALEMNSCSGTFSPFLPIHADTVGGDEPVPADILLRPDRDQSKLSPPSFNVEDLLHDARNLTGALALYCDLLSMPDVLGAEHRHYAEGVRLLGTRWGELIEQLIENLIRLSLVQSRADELRLGLVSVATDTSQNLMAELGHYADLLSKPGVLKPERRFYAEDVRSVGARCGALIEQLRGSLPEAGIGGRV